MTGRTYDPNLDDVYVNRDGTIRWNGDPIGVVTKLDDSSARMVGGSWRAEIGNAASPDDWPGYRATYGRTRAGVVRDVLEGVEVPA